MKLKINDYIDVVFDFFYLDSDGVLRRKVDGYYGRYKKGDEVTGHAGAGGYLALQFPKHRFTVRIAHIVYVLKTGTKIPEGSEIDHIDGVRDNNHPDNLRCVTRTTNAKNRKRRSDNTSGITGIRWSEYHQHYVIRRTVKGKRLRRSRKTLEEAIEVLEDLTQMDSCYTERHGK